MASQWEFPGGKIEAGESPEQALVRELEEELGIHAVIGPHITHIRHNFHRHGGAVDLQFFAVHEFSGEIVNRIYNEVRWTKLEDLTGYDFLAADRGLIRDLAAGKLLLEPVINFAIVTPMKSVWDFWNEREINGNRK